MSTTEQSSVTEEFEEFLKRYYKEKVMELAKSYPKKKSIEIEFSDLEKYDLELAEELLKSPDKTIKAAEEALLNIDLPIDKKLKESHVRFIELPTSERVLARNIRSHHIGNFISMEGIIRKATEVRPKLTKAHFECLRCGTEQKVRQEGSDFREPYECSGCERKGPFELNEDNSEFTDAQKLQIQEVPEKLRGGEQPQDINVRVTDDITGTGVPGNRVVINGVLRSYQKTNTKGKTNLFDVYLDCNSIEIKEQEFSEIEITEEEKEKIIELSENPEIYQKIKDSIAPSIYGYDKVKEAMALQLFSGIPKNLPDGSRIRGDIHTLLVGDPGIGKCVKGDTKVLLKNGEQREIKKVVEEKMESPKKQGDTYYQEVDLKIPSFDENWKSEINKVTKVIKREAPAKMFKITTNKGKKIEITPNHPLFTYKNEIKPIKPNKLNKKDYIAVQEKLETKRKDEKNPNKNTKTDSNSPKKINDVKWEQIQNIEIIEPEYNWVYDLEVPKTHTYITNGIISHNSQILRYVANLAPRGVYASGKSSTSAGLCVSPNTVVPTSDGFFKIQELVEKNINNPKEVKPGFYKEDINTERFLFSFNDEDSIESTELESLWKIEAPEEVIEIITESNKKIEVTPMTALPMKKNESVEWVKAKNLSLEDEVPVTDLKEKVAREKGSEEFFSESNVYWDEINQINQKEPDYDFVYDVTVDEHNFLANGLYVHNTAAAVRDEFGDGKWTLEAGALVLADKGVATIDEIDKMDSNDRSALHEAMEQQSISIAKAGITATLKSRCALLGAANPTYGRFDEYEPIGEQIDLEPTLLSRFDLIFTIRDKPDKDQDGKVASHIITSHETGERSRKGEEKEGGSEDIEPEIGPDMLRKYIAFSKKVTPVLTPDAKERLKDFYLDLRVAGEEEGSPVPVTARQLEALIRLAEASARTRLNENITSKDAKRAIKIVKESLEEVGIDPETGEFDIDVLATGTSKSQREKIRTIEDIIDELDQGGEGAKKVKVIDRAKEEGIEEKSARDIIKRLREGGDIIEPRTGKTLRTT